MIYEGSLINNWVVSKCDVLTTYLSCLDCILIKIDARQGEFKHEVRQFEKSYDNQQAEQISLMV